MKKLLVALLTLALLLSSTAALAELEVQEFPASGDMYEMIDPADPYKTVISGLFHQDITTDDISRECYVYIGAENRQMEANVTLIPDSGVNVSDFLVDSGWQAIADEQGLILLIAQPEAGGWDTEKDLDYLNTMWTLTHVRNWYNCQKHNSYMLAYGDAATLGQMWGMQAVSPQKLVSFATFGDFAVDADFIAETSAQDTRLEGVRVGDIPMPVWFYVSELSDDAQAVLAHWNAANNVGEEVLSSENATAIYTAKINATGSIIDEQDYMAQTRYTVADDAADYTNIERNRAVWDFLSAVIRPVGYANNQLHAYRSLEDWGASKQTVDVDGITRYWVEYVPEHLCETEDGKAPLVVFFHGNNQGAETYNANCEALKLAEDRGFIAMVMTGALYNQDTQMPNPRWNLTKSEEEFDDYAYVRAAIEDTVARLPVDTTRIYAQGLSYGSMATQMFSLAMSDVFAACAPVSGVFNGILGGDTINELVTDFPSENLMPICLIQGEFDNLPTGIDDADLRRDFSIWLTVNGLDADFDKSITGSYKTGRYNMWAFANESGVPLVKYGWADERIHTAVLEDLYLAYDGFLSLYSRGEDGTLYYMGQAVEK